MSTFPAARDGRPPGPGAPAFCRRLRQEGVTDVVTVPDFVQMSVHERLDSGTDGIRSIYCCTEDQALTTAAGLYVGGRTPFVIVQNQGLYKCMNTLRAVCIDAGVPLVLCIGQFGREADNDGRPMRESRRSVVSLLEPALDAFGVPCRVIECDEDLHFIGEAFSRARANRGASALIVGRNTAWTEQ